MNKELSKLYDEFYELNRPYWDVPVSEKARENVLFCTHNPDCYINPNIWAMLFVKKYQELHPCNIIISSVWKFGKEKRKFFESFNIDKFVSFSKLNLYAFLKTLSHVPGVIACRNGEELLKMKVDHNTVPVGENIYDLLERVYSFITINRVPLRGKIKALSYIYLYYSFKKFATVTKIDTLIYTDCDYLYSAFIKVCQKLHIKNFQCCNLYNIQHLETGYKSISCMQITRSKFKRFTSIGNFNQVVEDEFRKRFAGTKANYWDVTAYKNKKMYKKEELLQLYGLKDDRKCVVIMSHAFFDLAHSAFDMVYKDDYDWLVNTIKILAGIDKYNVFVKEHPSASSYGRNGVVSHILEKEGVTNVYKLPEDLSALCLFNFVDCFVTFHGTIAIEAACFGLPTITASKGYYYGYGLDYNFSDYESYKHCLENIELLKKRPEIIDRAKSILAVTFYDFFSSVRSGFSSMLSNLESFEMYMDEYKTLKTINGCLRKYSPKDDYYNSLMENLLIFDDDCIPSRMTNNFDSS